MKFGKPEILWLLLSLPLLIVLFHWFTRIAGKKLERFASPELLVKLIKTKSMSVRRWKLVFLITATACLIIALARPQLGIKPMEVKRTGVDILFALDTSYSMAAEDVPPNRLAKAKMEIEKLADDFTGNRVGLLLFAGESAIECPLTWDVSTFKLFLNQASFNSVQRGGSDISGAIRKATASLKGSSAKSKVLVLITDGEDHSGNALAATKKAAEKGIRIYTVGLGSDKNVPIPMRDENGALLGYKKDSHGEMALTRMNDAELREIAFSTDAIYASSSDGGRLDLGPLVESIRKLEKSDITSTRFTSYVERFQLFLALCILFLFAEWLL